MWSPREATSVATRTGSFPSLKSFRMRSRPPPLKSFREPRRFFRAPVAGRGARLPAVPAEAVFEPPRRLARVGEDQDPGPALALQEAPAAAEILPPAVV